MTRRPTVVAILAVITMLVLPAPAASAAPTDDASSLEELQAKRENVQADKAAQATEVNAVEATDAEVKSALSALSAQVDAQRDRVEETERVLAEAEADRAAAEAAQRKAQAQLDRLHEQIRRSAVEAYVNIGSAAPAAAVATDNMNDAVNKRVLLESRAGRSQDLVEEFRAVQEDLELQRAAKASAEKRAAAQRDAVAARKADLEASYAEQQSFAAEVEARLDAALAEAASLQRLDAGLSKQITAKQAEIARVLKAQREAAEARAAQRAAVQKAALTPSPRRSSGGSGSSGGGYAVSGSGPIVSVGGIRVHQSIAGNLRALLSAAAGDGIHLSGGGYRDPSGQIRVRRNNCGSSHYAIYEMPASACSPPTARPGTSMHEQGLAIDFTQGGGTLGRGSSGFHWLKANASRFGLYNLPSEPWHWSTNGN